MSTQNHYLLLTPGPLTTSLSVKEVMLKDWCTWDNEYNSIVQEIRSHLLSLAAKNTSEYTTVLMQGSGTFSVESVIGTAIPANGKLLVLVNGAYGMRIAEIARYLKIEHTVIDFSELCIPDNNEIEEALITDPLITHVAVVHCETTTGILNPIHEIGNLVKKHNKIYIVDAMSSFGGIPFDMEEIGIDYLVSSANKCIQGVPGFGFTIARRHLLEQTKGNARSLSLDMYDQWETMEKYNGKWRFTSATHTVRAFAQALEELNAEGGVESRFIRYAENQRRLVNGMRNLGFHTLLPDGLQSPIITTFISPDEEWFIFNSFYAALKAKGFVIYPGKVTNHNCFRIGNIGEVNPTDIDCLIDAVFLSVNEFKGISC
jgi:2-aminoethylphosphonate-pyruvate transaminase